MKRIAGLFALLLMLFAWPCHALELLDVESLEESPARIFKVEVLQVANIEPYQESYDGFMKVLKDSGIVQGKNLVVHRVIIDFDVENGGFWSKVGALFRVRQEAVRIANAEPDMVLTIGTPATRYAKEVLADSNIPIVFTAVAVPEAAGCNSIADCGIGVTGATLYMDMTSSMKLVKALFPANTLIGMIHTNDENGVAHVAEAAKAARKFGMAVVSKEVRKQENIGPAIKELYAEGVRMFAVPLDTYYGLRKFEPAKELSNFGVANEIPIISFALSNKSPGAVLTVGADFGVVGGLSGTQAVKILRQNAKPEVLFIMKQATPIALLEPERIDGLKVALPQNILDRKHVRSDGMWQVDMANSP